VRHPRDAERPAATTLLDDLVGPGFCSFDGADAEISFVAVTGGRVAGVLLARLAAAGYTPRADIAGFFAQGSIESGARCPYCGEPPCRCAVRPFVKRLEPAAD
jgi:hypothetical protein